jgi:hypothetical protein
MLETEKNEKNNTVGKLKTLFKKIKNFDQLKEEVFEMKKTFQQTYEDVNSIKNRYSTINDKMKDINKIIGGNTSFEQIQEDNEFKLIMREKMRNIDKKFKVVLGDLDVDENEMDENNYNENEKSKNKNSKKNKIFNLVEMSKRINQYQFTKVNASEFELKQEENKKSINDLEKKLNDILTSLYGDNNDENNNSNNNIINNINNAEHIGNKNFLFTTKNEFEKYKAKTDEEINKIWEKISNLNKQYEEIFNKIKDNCTLNDLDAMKNVILEKTKELFLTMKNKDIDNTSLQTLQKNFKKLLKLLADKEEKENWLLAKKPIGNYSCASCENYLGNLKDDTDKHIHWKKLPIKIKNKESNDNIYKIGNGYSRLLRMINFDSNGIPSLNPFENMSEHIKSIPTNMNENSKSKEHNDLNKSGYNQSFHNITSKYFSKEKNETINLKTRNKLDKSERRLPNIIISNSTDYFDKSGKKINPSMSSFNFMSPRLTKNHRKNYYKYDI